uniref:Uncharacterized protein n=1 Tax=Caenorhabditis japonica TaxID=281687 RepID=A0A8R1HRT1_CAEJA
MFVEPIRPTYRLILRYKIDFILTPDKYRERRVEINQKYGVKDLIYLTYETAEGNRFRFPPEFPLPTDFRFPIGKIGNEPE